MRSLSSSRLVVAGFVLSLFAVSCGDDEPSDDDSCERGTEGCRCKSDDTCDAGLVCDEEEDECVDAGSGGSAGRAGAGGKGGKGGSSGSTASGGKGGSVSSGGSTSSGGSSAGTNPLPAGNGGDAPAGGTSGEGGDTGSGGSLPGGSAGEGGEGNASSGGSGALAGEGGEGGEGVPVGGSTSAGGSSGGPSAGLGGFGGSTSAGGSSGGPTAGFGGFGGSTSTGGAPPGGNGGAGGSSAGTSAGGSSGGGSGGTSAGTSGSGGKGGVGCTPITLTSNYLVDDEGWLDEVINVYYTLGQNLGEAEAGDVFELSFYSAPATGSFTLGTGVDDNYDSCERCVLVRQDDEEVWYFASAGTLTLAGDSRHMNGYPKGTLSNVTLQEVTFSGNTSIPVVGGRCLTLASATINVPPPTSGFLNCPASYYGDSWCDCGCGALDSDCGGETDSGACEYCYCEGDGGECLGSAVLENNNALCGAG